MVKRKLRARGDGNTAKEDQFPEKRSYEVEQEPEKQYEFKELNPDEISLGYDNDIKDWLMRNKLLDNEHHVSVYKYLNPHTGDRKELVNQYTDYLPSEHEIGISYGSGRYIVLLNITDNKGERRIASAKFRLHASYDDMRYKGQVGQLTGSIFGGNGGRMAGGSMNESLELIGKIMALLLPAIKPTDSPVNYSEMMMENYKVFNSMLKRSMLDSMQLATDLTRERLNLAETVESEGEATGIGGVLQTIAPMIEQIIPMITCRSNAKSKATIQAVKQLPQYKQIVQSKKAMNELIDFIDKKHGKEIADKIITKFGVKRAK